MWFCEFTLRFFRSEKGWLRHHVSHPPDCLGSSYAPLTPACDNVAQARNKQRHPPGDEIYRKDNISM